MRRRFTTVSYIIFGLIAVGILAKLWAHPGTLLVPLIVFGVIFLLYKYPPSTWRGNQMYKAFTATKRPTANDRRTRKAKFKVIKGSKPDDPQEPPKYH
ncbi:MAG: hypothetical protein K0R75_2999 [Paenibacillaceae bacterium]|nr:hypothetical protein [Paenibacillaceae bacterium]